MKRVAIAGIAALSFAAGIGWTRVQQQATSTREPQFDNAQVEVWKSIILPKQPLTFHRHDNYRVLVALTDGQLDMVDKSGKVLDTYHLVKGKAMWLGP
ncbi:MAG TPA: hypothetical protein VHV78_05770, partial [Gemmatimonadaceae bacterium]|nr:hypothetical protein [Gemmatimonadaceae bacterium]